VPDVQNIDLIVSNSIENPERIADDRGYENVVKHAEQPAELDK
jgi:hypothetical protein